MYGNPYNNPYNNPFSTPYTMYPGGAMPMPSPVINMQMTDPMLANAFGSTPVNPMFSSVTDQIDRLREFRRVTRNRGLFHLYSQAGAYPSLRRGIFSMMGFSDSASRYYAGLTSSRYMSQIEHTRMLRQEAERRSDEISYLLGMHGGKGSMGLTIGGYAANLVGLGGIYENTFGWFDRVARSASRAANKLTYPLERIADREDIVDQRYGRGFRGRELATKIAEIIADNKELKKYVSKNEFRRLYKTTGVRGFWEDIFNPSDMNRFNATEIAQIIERTAEMGEFNDILGTIRDKQGRIFKPTNEYERELYRKELAKKIGLRGRRIASNISYTQKILGVEDVGEATKLLKAISENRGMDKITPNDLRNIKKLRDDLKLTNKAIEQIFEAGRDLARRYGLATSKGTDITITTQRLIRNLQNYGPSRTLFAQLGKENIAAELTKAQVGLEKSDQGKMITALQAQINQLRTRGDYGQADKLEKRLLSQITTKGMIDLSLVKEGMEAVEGKKLDISTVYRDIRQKAHVYADIVKKTTRSAGSLASRTMKSLVQYFKRIAPNDVSLQAKMLAKRLNIDEQVARKLIETSEALDFEKHYTNRSNIASEVLRIYENDKLNFRDKLRALKELYGTRELEKYDYRFSTLKKALEQLEAGNLEANTERVSDFIDKNDFARWEKLRFLERVGRSLRGIFSSKVREQNLEMKRRDFLKTVRKRALLMDVGKKLNSTKLDSSIKNKILEEAKKYAESPRSYSTPGELKKASGIDLKEFFDQQYLSEQQIYDRSDFKTKNIYTPEGQPILVYRSKFLERLGLDPNLGHQLQQKFRKRSDLFYKLDLPEKYNVRTINAELVDILRKENVPAGVIDTLINYKKRPFDKYVRPLPGRLRTKRIIKFLKAHLGMSDEEINKKLSTDFIKPFNSLSLKEKYDRVLNLYRRGEISSKEAMEVIGSKITTKEMSFKDLTEIINRSRAFLANKYKSKKIADNLVNYLFFGGHGMSALARTSARSIIKGELSPDQYTGIFAKRYDSRNRVPDPLHPRQVFIPSPNLGDLLRRLTGEKNFGNTLRFGRRNNLYEAAPKDEASAPVKTVFEKLLDSTLSSKDVSVESHKELQRIRKILTELLNVTGESLKQNKSGAVKPKKQKTHAGEGGR